MSDIHLYFIAIDNVKDMINIMLSEEKLIFLKSETGEFYQMLEHFTHGRNTFEHFDDRIPGGKKHEKVGEVKSNDKAGPRRILGGIHGDVYVFGDKKWSLSHKQFQEIIDGMSDFEKRIHRYLDHTSNK